MRERLHAFYARLAQALQHRLAKIETGHPAAFSTGLVRLCGLAVPEMIQLVCFHEMHGKNPEQADVRIHHQAMLLERLPARQWRPLAESASCEIELKDWLLQIRIKPMNKFTTTAIKINCSVRF